jgi:hypothetical protein
VNSNFPILIHSAGSKKVFELYKFTFGIIFNFIFCMASVAYLETRFTADTDYWSLKITFVFFAGLLFLTLFDTFFDYEARSYHKYRSFILVWKSRLMIFELKQNQFTFAKTHQYELAEIDVILVDDFYISIETNSPTQICGDTIAGTYESNAIRRAIKTYNNHHIKVEYMGRVEFSKISYSRPS